MEHLTSEKKIPLVLPGEEAYLILARETISKHLNSGLQATWNEKSSPEKNSYAYNTIQNLQF